MRTSGQLPRRCRSSSLRYHRNELLHPLATIVALAALIFLCHTTAEGRTSPPASMNVVMGDCVPSCGNTCHWPIPNRRFRRAFPLGNDAAPSLSMVLVAAVPRGGGLIPSGYHPMGYAVTSLGLRFLDFEGSRDSDVGRFLSSIKSGRKKLKVIKDQWLEVVRVSKTGQSMRIYRMLDELLKFCLEAGFIN